MVGEAPGRLGAERTGVPFSGDASGRRFEALLAAAGWTRRDVFITNAVLCNPRDPAGRNRPPTRTELAACHDHLEATLAVVEPRVVVALGRRALAALGTVHPHHVGAATPPGELAPWRERQWIGWLFHPSPLTQTRRTLDTQRGDWQRLRLAVDRLPDGPAAPSVAESGG